MNNQSKYQEVDKYLCDHWDVPNDYFDRLLDSDPTSNYLFGMKVYFTANESNVKKYDVDILKYSNQNEFIKLAKSRINQIKGNDAEAILSIKDALKLNPKNKWCLLELYVLTGSIDNELLDSILEMHPTFSRAKLYKAYNLHPANDCQYIIGLLSNFPQTLHTSDSKSFLGEAYYLCNNPEKAKECFEHSLSLKESTAGYLGLGTLELYSNRDYEKAKSYFEKGLKMNPKDLSLLLSMGWLNYEIGDDSSAESYFRFSSTLDGFNEEHYEDAIKFFILINKFEVAKQFLVKMIEEHGQSYLADGFEFILDFKTLNESEKKHKFKKFYDEYGEVGYDWLLKTLQQLGY